MAIDIGGDDGLQQHEEGEQAEGGVEAGLMGDEADGVCGPWFDWSQ